MFEHFDEMQRILYLEQQLSDVLFFLSFRYERPRLRGLERGRFPPLSAPRHHSLNVQVDVVTP